MNKDEKFVMEKLRLYNETLEEEVEVSEEFKNRLSQIKLEPAPKPAEQKTKTKKIAFFSTVSTVAAALIITLCLVFIPGKSTTPSDYQDKDLSRTDLSFTEFNSQYTVLLPAVSLENTTFKIFSDKSSKKTVYCNYIVSMQGNGLEIHTVFVNNYTIKQNDKFENLDKTGSNALINYSYKIAAATNTAYAKFEHGGYKYFLTFTSENPEDITEVLGGLKLNK